MSARCNMFRLLRILSYVLPLTTFHIDPSRCNTYSYFLSQYDLSTTIRFHSIFSRWNPFWSIIFQAIPVEFIISHHVPYQKLHVEIHSVPFCPNLIRWRLSYSIAYCHVAIHYIPSHPDWICHLLSCAIYIKTRCNTFSSFQSLSILILFIYSHNVLYCIFMLLYILSQVVLIVFIVSHCVTYWNLCIAIHTIPFRTNIILRLLSHSIEYCQVTIHSVPGHHNQIHDLI